MENQNNIKEDLIEKNKERFINLLLDNVKRDGVNSLIDKLNNSDFFIAPASTQYHSAYKGGLCQHSLNVYDRLLNLVTIEYGEDFNKKADITLESITIIALLHDFSKMNFYETSERNVKEGNNWIKVPYIKVRDDAFVFGSHSVNAMYQLGYFISLTHMENCCILHHMGGKDYSDNISNDNQTTKMFNKYPLVTLTHIADLQATFLDERLI